MKQALAWEEEKLESITFIQKTCAAEDFLYLQSNSVFYRDPDHLELRVSGMGRPDIVHVHNLPDWMGIIVKNVWPEVPMFYDCHDLISIRDGQMTDQETEVMRLADGYSFPSYVYLREATKLHGLEATPWKPRGVMYSMCATLDMVELPKKPIIGGICYEGGIIAQTDELSIRGAYPYHRDYTGFAKVLQKYHIPFYIYGMKEAFRPVYEKLGVVCIPPIQPTRLVAALSRHHWGFVGTHLKNNVQWHGSMPNKLFEFLMAGLPILVHGADEVAEFVTKHKLGVALDNLKSIPKVYNDWPEWRFNVIASRSEFLMNSQIEKLSDLYERTIQSFQRTRASDRAGAMR